jgi:tetratricopeptide (TPR) repeat protein
MNTIFDLLGIDPDADDETLKQAFRKAVRRTHPDLNGGDPEASVRFRQIVVAYDALRDAKQRAARNKFPKPELQSLRSKLNRIVMSAAIAIAVATVSLLGGYGYGLFVSTPATDVLAGKKDNDTSTAIEGTRADIDGGPTKFAAGQAATPANKASQDRSHDKHDGVEAADGVSKPIAAATASDGDVEVIADRGAAIGVLTNDANFHREQGIALQRSGDFQQAIASLDEAIRLDPNNAQAYDIRANAWDEMGIFERALADYDEAIRIDPNNPVLFHDRGIMWQHKGEFDRALVDLDRAIRFSFSDATIYCERGLVWYEKGHPDRAMADFSQAMKLDPDLASTCINRGMIVHHSTEFDVVLDFGDNAIRVDPRIFDTIQRINVRFPEVR